MLLLAFLITIYAAILLATGLLFFSVSLSWLLSKLLTVYSEQL